MEVLLRFDQITKCFGNLTVNDRISFAVRKGETVALLGENGAGKTTLMNILFGHYCADEGQIFFDGKPLPTASPQAALRAGIGMVHQHFTLAESMSVLENVLIGTQPLWALRLDLRNTERRLRELIETFDFALNPHTRVDRLTVGEKQRVEILKVLYRGARLLILDEPTAVLTPQQSESLLVFLDKMRAQGLAAIFISHKLHEVLRASQQVIVLRHGRVVMETSTANCDSRSLAAAMVGAEVERPQRQPRKHGEVLLELSEVAAQYQHYHPICKMNLKLHRGEMLGIAGVAGNGQNALSALISGLVAPQQGFLKIQGQVLRTMDALVMRRHGVGVLPEDRHVHGIIGEMTLWENWILDADPRSIYWYGGNWLREGLVQKSTLRAIKDFDIRCDSLNQQACLLSGGNMQKLILARLFAKQPAIIFANQPTRGLDEGAIAFVHQQLFNACAGGAAVIVISEDLDELLALADTLAVICEGYLSPTFGNGTRTRAEIGAFMAGNWEQLQAAA